MAFKTGTLLAALIVTIAGTAQAFAPTSHDVCDLIPQNARYMAPLAGTGIDEKMFNRVLDEIEAYYAPIFKQRGATLQVERLWTDGTVNAYATQNGTTWTITMFGGLARSPEVTPDAFAAVACHELGHHLGGQPKYDGGTNWAAVEGQADYHATAKCLRKIFDKGGHWLTPADQADLRRLATDPTVDKECASAFGVSTHEGEICVRSSAAGLQLALLLANLGGEPAPKFDTPDKNKVKTTDENHPAAQCRLDTYFAGAICKVSKDIDFSDTDETVGACNAPDTGFRPACWFAPGSQKAPAPEPAPGGGNDGGGDQDQNPN